MKKNAKKGFTLIEIIVVLVILAILAAAAIPTMNGFIKDAEGKQYIAEARAAMLGCKYLEAQDDGKVTPFVCDSAKAIALAGVETTGAKISQVGNIYTYVADGTKVIIEEGVGTTIE